MELRSCVFFSDGNTGLVFSFQQTLKNVEELPNTFVYGQMSTYTDIFVMGETSLLIVVFHPYGFNHLVGIPANEIKDLFVSTENLLDKSVIELHEKLGETISKHQQVQVLENYFLKILANQKLLKETPLVKTIDFIYQKQGMISIQELSQVTNLHERKIQRLFKEKVGVRPKEFINTIKLHNFLRSLRSTSENLTTLSYEAGYYDQAHLIREFKKITGIRPKDYHRDKTLAVNFIEI